MSVSRGQCCRSVLRTTGRNVVGNGPIHLGQTFLCSGIVFTSCARGRGFETWWNHNNYDVCHKATCLIILTKQLPLSSQQ